QVAERRGEAQVDVDVGGAGARSEAQELEPLAVAALELAERLGPVRGDDHRLAEAPDQGAQLALARGRDSVEAQLDQVGGGAVRLGRARERVEPVRLEREDELHRGASRAASE